MKGRTLTRILIVLILTTFGATLATIAGAEERQRGVRAAQTMNGIVLEHSAFELKLRNESGDHALRITAQTTIMGELRVAVQAQVRYKTGKDGRMEAVSIQVKPERIELSGVIEELLPDGFVAVTSLGEVTVRVNENTVILIAGALGTLTDLLPGDHVEIDAVPGEEDELLALVIITESSAIELQGRISAISDDLLTLYCLERATEIGLTDETIVRIYGREATIADLVVDMCARIYAKRLDDGSLEALFVEVSWGFKLEEVNGIVATASDTELVVLARQGAVFTFAITPETLIFRRNEAIDASDITPGDFVQVKAVEDVTLGPVAVRIRVENPGLHYRDVIGVITRVEGSLLTLTLPDDSELEVLVSSHTIIRVGREKGSIADLVPGNRVEVHLWRNPDESASAIAIKIVILEDEIGELDFHGTVVTIDTILLTIRTARVGELGFVLDDATLVTSGGVAAELSDIRPGVVVDVHAVSAGGGILTATRVDIESSPPINDTAVEGEVVKVSAESIMLEAGQGKVTFTVTPTTVVLIDDVPASIDDVLVGDHARIESSDEKGKKTATKIEVHR